MGLASMRVAAGFGLAAVLLLYGCAAVHTSGLAFTPEDGGLESEVRFASAARQAFATVRAMARDRRLVEFDCGKPDLQCTGYTRDDLVIYTVVTPGPPRRVRVVITQSFPLMERTPPLVFHEELLARVRGSVTGVRLETQ
jgi:hypothetical protein